MLGQVVMTSKQQRADKTLYSGTVDCSGLQDAPVTLVLRGTGSNGMLVCFSGGQGTRPWGTTESAANCLSKLHTRGIRTVEVRWSAGWLKGDQSDGPKALACRPATVLDWIGRQLQPTGFFAATGNSAGAAALGYAMSFYGIDLDLAVLTSGPVFSYVDKACSGIAPYGYARSWAIATIDGAYGYGGTQPGPCELKTYAVLSPDNIVGTGGRYRRDNVHFLFGGLDQKAILAQGTAYYDALVAAGSLNVTRHVLPGVGHNLHSEQAGADAIYQTVVNGL